MEIFLVESTYLLLCLNDNFFCYNSNYKRQLWLSKSVISHLSNHLNFEDVFLCKGSILDHSKPKGITIEWFIYYAIINYELVKKFESVGP